ncbi:MAG: hypothetical protein ACM3O7_03245 [Acidobacteriota bacterium]
MSLLQRVFARPRLLAEIRFVFGAALIGAAAGLALALLLLPPSRPGFPTSPVLARWVHAIAPGFAYGWWGGLLWSSFMALSARRATPSPPVSSLPIGVWIAATFTVVGGAASRWITFPPTWGILAGLLAGTLAARLWLAHAAARAARP